MSTQSQIDIAISMWMAREMIAIIANIRKAYILQTKYQMIWTQMI